MAYQATIGLEIHAELKTKTKMFCSCKNDPNEKHPNVNVCPICLGHPGTLPVANKEAIRAVLRLGTALGAELADESRFDRKNYFYPDLPKGYQISQYQHPLVKSGVLELPFSRKEVRITRIHLEEDTARNVHDKNSKSTLVDFNRSGVPLMELVTEPDMFSAKEAREFAEELQLILRYLGISDADMEKGQMRVEANVSVVSTPRGKTSDVFGDSTSDVEERGDSPLGTKVEVKNINSFRNVERAIDYEIRRQSELLEKGERVKQETRGWDDIEQKTISQRSKEEAHDYRYFPEPDLPPLKLSEVPEFNSLALDIPELPNQKRARFRKEYGVDLPAGKAGGEKLEVFVRDKKLSEFFEEAVSEAGEPRLIPLLVNYLTSDLLGLIKERKLVWEDLRITPENFGELIGMIAKGEVSSRGAKDILKIMVETGEDPSDIAEKEGLLQTSDAAALESICKKVMEANPKAAEDFKAGKEASLQFLVGQAMREAKSRKIGANPEILRELFSRLLSN